MYKEIYIKNFTILKIIIEIWKKKIIIIVSIIINKNESVNKVWKLQTYD